ncbi:hypothetical protein [Levilactobacillus angrenensis]|uniref:Uncharacterized protein n=1 Tax=Levilactobacillus angrenensis TaxID=2486020 RepID=A0ABW1UC67_9LACO|nr:hypothetical protein [Levilactobacillus angrenensis]
MSKNFEVGRPREFGNWDYRVIPFTYQRYFAYCQREFPADCKALSEFQCYFCRMHYGSAAADQWINGKYLPPNGADSLFGEWDLDHLRQTGEVVSPTEPHVVQRRMPHLTIWDYWLSLQGNLTWADAEETDFVIGDADILPLAEVTHRMQEYLDWLKSTTLPFPDYDNFLYWYCQSGVFMMLTAWQYDLPSHTPATFAAFLADQQAVFLGHVRTYMDTLNGWSHYWKN